MRTIKFRSGVGTRDEAFLETFGSPPPIISDDVGHSGDLGRAIVTNPNVIASEAAMGVPNYYIPINPSIWKSYVAVPTNQGQRGGIAARQSMMFDPRNSPSRSQFVQAYTDPVQSFAAGNTWQTPSGLSSKGNRGNQPSIRKVSPFSTVPIPTRMPWDL
jgi:hypothetical protein